MGAACCKREHIPATHGDPLAASYCSVSAFGQVLACVDGKTCGDSQQKVLLTPLLPLPLTLTLTPNPVP